MEKFTVLLIILIVLLKGGVCDDSEATFLSKFVQNDFKIRNVRTETNSYNKNYVNFLKVTTFKYNRTTTAINGTINVKANFGDKLMATVQGYKFLSNQYRKFPALRFQVNFCKAVNSNIAGARAILDCGNFSRCFFEKEVTYHFCNFVLDETHLPPHVPTGEYMATIELIYLNHVAFIINLYLEVYYPVEFHGIT